MVIDDQFLKGWAEARKDCANAILPALEELARLRADLGVAQTRAMDYAASAEAAGNLVAKVAAERDALRAENDALRAQWAQFSKYGCHDSVDELLSAHEPIGNRGSGLHTRISVIIAECDAQRDTVSHLRFQHDDSCQKLEQLRAEVERLKTLMTPIPVNEAATDEMSRLIAAYRADARSNNPPKPLILAANPCGIVPGPGNGLIQMSPYAPSPAVTQMVEALEKGRAFINDHCSCLEEDQLEICRFIVAALGQQVTSTKQRNQP